MEISKKLEEGVLTVTPVGRIDTLTAPEFEGAVTDEGVNEIVFDFAQVVYISSAGLRVLLKVQKTMAAKGKVTIRNATAPVKEVFDITGFSNIFTFA